MGKSTDRLGITWLIIFSGCNIYRLLHRYGWIVLWVWRTYFVESAENTKTSNPYLHSISRCKYGFIEISRANMGFGSANIEQYYMIVDTDSRLVLLDIFYESDIFCLVLRTRQNTKTSKNDDYLCNNLYIATFVRFNLSEIQWYVFAISCCETEILTVHGSACFSQSCGLSLDTSVFATWRASQVCSRLGSQHESPW